MEESFLHRRSSHRPTTYQPFDKTSPTASMDAVYMVLIFAQHMRMNIEVCDVPSAYLNTPLPKGKKHLMRIKPLLAKYFVRADNSAKEFLQADGSLLVQLEKALYGLPEAGKLWHKLLRDNLGQRDIPTSRTTPLFGDASNETAKEERRLYPLYWYS
jgi:hypothetical protein